MNQTIKDAAEQYTPTSVKNIVELQSVPVNLLVQEAEGMKDNEKFSYKFVEVNGEKYRLPVSVLKDLKAVLKKKPTLQNFSVTKSGEGRNTKYTLIPLD